MSECLDGIFLVCLIMSAQYLLNHATIFLKTKLGIVVSYRESMCPAEKLVCIFSVKVTAGAYIIKI